MVSKTLIQMKCFCYYIAGISVSSTWLASLYSSYGFGHSEIQVIGGDKIIKKSKLKPCSNLKWKLLYVNVQYQTNSSNADK